MTHQAQTTSFTGPSPNAVNGASPSVLHRFENVEFDELEGLLRVAGLPVEVEPRPLRVLAELLQRVNEVVTKEELMDSVWEGRTTVEHVLANAVSKLRAALGEMGAARVVTVPRVGYRLQGPVHRVDLRARQHRFVAGEAVRGREDFVLERPLGEGSRSDVWLARHAKLGHAHVFKFADDGARLSALKREYTLYRVLRQELGPRDDIALVLDSNFVQAPYFLECEYGGQSLLEWAQTDAQLVSLSRPERIALFLQIADAVAAAHSVGVLHKDIKPGNVLLQLEAGDPDRLRVRLTDFGSGRLLEPARLEALKLTRLGLTATQDASSDAQSGTLMYLAPELISGQAATVQSDLFALGVMLYQLLAGDLRKPLTTGWQRDIDDELLCEDVTRATEGEPKQRDQSVADWASSVAQLEARCERRIQSQQDAAQALRVEVERRQQRSRRPWVMFAFASLVLGLLLSHWFYRQAATSLAALQVETKRAKAISEFLNRDVLQAADITGVGPKKSLLIPDVLASASKKATLRFEGLPEAESEVRLHLGELFFRLSSYKAAEDEFAAALRLTSGLKSTGPETSLEARYALVRALVGQSKLDEAQAMLDEAARAEQVSPTSNAGPGALAEARAKGVYLSMRQRYAESVQSSRLAVELSDKLKPADLPARFVARRMLAEVLFRVGDYPAVELMLNEMMSMPFSSDTVGDVVFARVEVQRARLLKTQGKLAQSEQPLLAAIEAISRRLGADEYSISSLHEEMGRVYGEQGKFELAEQAYARASSIVASNFGADHQGARVNALNEVLVGLDNGQAARVLVRLNEERPWFVKNMGGERSPVVQLIDFFRVRASLDLRQTKLAAELLPGLEPKTLNQAGATEWEETLQAERARLLILTGKAQEGLALMKDAMIRLEPANAATMWSLRRYQSLLASSGTKRQH